MNVRQANECLNALLLGPSLKLSQYLLHSVLLVCVQRSIPWPRSFLCHLISMKHFGKSSLNIQVESRLARGNCSNFLASLTENAKWYMGVALSCTASQNQNWKQNYIYIFFITLVHELLCINIKYIHSYTYTNNFIYVFKLFIQATEQFIRELSREKFERKLFERVSEVCNSFS